MKNYKINNELGLTTIEVNERIINNQVNYDTVVPTKSIMKIIHDNIFTLFNILNFGLALAILFVGSFKNLAFMGVVICNTLIGIIQEVNAKRIIDKLSLISEKKAKVIRDGKTLEISLNQIVIDDLIIMNNGNQVICDSIILEGSCEVNESLITGESDPIYKHIDDELLSGSFIVSGEVKVQVKHVGTDNYSAQITKEAKTVKSKKSVLMYSLNKIIKVISITIVPLGVVLFLKQISIEDNNINMAVINTVAALIGMIPEGLILLTSTVLAVSIIRLSKYKVLVQQLYSVETLARIDTICLDKTGTLTDGLIEFVDFIKIDDIDNIDEIMSGLVVNLDSNNTIEALKKRYNLNTHWKVKDVVPFSSSRKWSGVNFESVGTFVMGAPEFIFKNDYERVSSIVNEYSSNYRVLVLAKSNYGFKNRILPKSLKPLGLILFRDNIRKEAVKTLQYFDEQGVNIKIISGDNVITVVDIASRLGIDTANNYVDASLLITDAELAEAALKYDIFGRVSPLQKKKIVKTLQANNHTVGFVGDGVNDVLALKTADCGVAMASGSDASRNVSELILLDSNFDSMPFVVNEGRRTINNIERSATLFLAKTIYATVLAILFLFISRPYPFEPIQLSLTSVFTIGIPSFVLAIEPNKERICGNFLNNVIGKAMPTAFTNVINVILIMVIGAFFNLSLKQTSTLAVILSAFVGFMLLYRISMPFNLIRLGLIVFGISGFLIGVLGLPDLFSLSELTLTLWVVMGLLMVISIINFKYLTGFYYKIKKKYPKYFD
ncbi:MAG: HAD-IC family P-type ATPase [Bacilli bacterium]|nr:HAD-IC family P-type ATPase [Bacilli bacterium]MDD4283040.1 HAD-IC family P-type ATPase [Bacilli bacterium]MDD4718494.1 HAD-IC family P-type ATPase [Bacilli bacterium]